MIAAISAIVGGLITLLLAAVISYVQRVSIQREQHRLRTLERHLKEYEKIFVTCRSTLDAFNDYVSIERRVSDRSDPFLRQLLDIIRDCSYQYCVAVDWRHNPGMAYLDLRLEEKCLRLRDLLLLWLSGTRLAYGDVLSVRRDDEFTAVSPAEIRRLASCDYQELRIERLPISVPSPGDRRLIADVQSAASSLIKDLKAVMSY